MRLDVSHMDKNIIPLRVGRTYVCFKIVYIFISVLYFECKLSLKILDFLVTSVELTELLTVVIP